MNEPVPPLRALETIPVKENGKEFILLRDPAGFSQKMLALAPEVLAVLSLFDGNHTLEQIAAHIEASTGEKVPVESLEGLVSLMDDARYLNSPSFLKERRELEDAFRKATVRDSTLAGSGYPGDADKLRELLDHYLASPPPDDFEPERTPEGTARGILLPHIDYQRGGMTYGRGYSALRDHLPDPSAGPLLVGVIGVAHNGAFAPLVFADKNFTTPCGPLEYDRRAIALVRSRLGETPFVEQWVHRAEHSVELQAVWLRHIFADREVTFLPMLAGAFGEGPSGTPGDNAEVREVLDTLKRVEEEHNGPVLWIASVDMAHVGPQFGDPEPVDSETRALIARQDMDALAVVHDPSADAWWKSITSDGNKRQVCGLYATYLFLNLVEQSHGSILDYQQAVTQSGSQMVSFAASLFI